MNCFESIKKGLEEAIDYEQGKYREITHLTEKKGSSRGLFAKYADPRKTDQEKDAWPNAVKEKK